MMEPIPPSTNFSHSNHGESNSSASATSVSSRAPPASMPDTNHVTPSVQDHDHTQTESVTPQSKNSENTLPGSTTKISSQTSKSIQDSSHVPSSVQKHVLDQANDPSVDSSPLTSVPSSNKEQGTLQAEDSRTESSNLTPAKEVKEVSSMKEPSEYETKRAKADHSSDAVTTSSLEEPQVNDQDAPKNAGVSSQNVQKSPSVENNPTQTEEASPGQSERASSNKSISPSPSAKRKRDTPTSSQASNIPSAACVKYLMAPLTEEQKRDWLGWAEFESNPVLMHYIIKQNGIEGVKVQDVISMENLPNSAYGLIFLFKYNDDGLDTDDLPKAPKRLWFANQAAANSCASVAIMNIVMNVPAIKLGEKLTSFKQETRLQKPRYRGAALAANEEIRIVHNSFARVLDTLGADQSVEMECIAYNKNKKRKISKKSKAKKKQNKKKVNENAEPCYHFVAFVPVRGSVWRLDGLENKPFDLGPINGGNWLDIARDNIMAQMATHPDDNSHVILALCPSGPTSTEFKDLESSLAHLKSSLAAKTSSLRTVEEKLTAINADWRFFQTESASPPREMESFGITEEVISAATPSKADEQKIKAARKDIVTLMRVQEYFVKEQKRLQKEYLHTQTGAVNQNEGEEDEDEEMYEAAIKKAKTDYLPGIYNTIKSMAENGSLRRYWNEEMEK